MVAFGSSMQGLWVGNRKVGSLVIGKDQSQLPGIEQLGKLGKKEDEEEEPATK